MAEDARYTPGTTAGAVGFMAARTIDSHARFVAPYLRPGLSVIDIGCGPGTITVGLAEAVAPGAVLGIDQGGAQLAQAQALAEHRGIGSVRFTTGSCDDLPVGDQSVDVVFAHALLEHLADPVRALREAYRVLRPGGVIAVCSPDWGGFLLSPATAAVDDAVAAYRALMESNGGDPLAGRHLAEHVRRAGYGDIQTTVRYEQYSDTSVIAAYLAAQLHAVEPAAAEALMQWAADPAAVFAQTWVSCCGRRPV